MGVVLPVSFECIIVCCYPDMYRIKGCCNVSMLYAYAIPLYPLPFGANERN